MKIPKGMTEQEVIKVIHEVSIALASKYRFGFHTLEDMQQQAKCEAIEGLDSYDPTRGAKLKTFLWTHVNNRLFNFKRDNGWRPDLPCLNCPLKAYDPYYESSHNQCTAFDDKHDCDPYHKWFNRNNNKRNIMSPVGIGSVKDEHETNMRTESKVEQQVDLSNIVNLIDEKIPVNLRKSWIKMKTDVKMTKPERNKLLEAIKAIVSEDEYGS